MKILSILAAIALVSNAEAAHLKTLVELTSDEGKLDEATKESVK